MFVSLGTTKRNSVFPFPVWSPVSLMISCINSGGTLGNSALQQQLFKGQHLQDVSAATPTLQKMRSHSPAANIAPAALQLLGWGDLNKKKRSLASYRWGATSLK